MAIRRKLVLRVAFVVHAQHKAANHNITTPVWEAGTDRGNGLHDHTPKRVSTDVPGCLGDRLHRRSRSLFLDNPRINSCRKQGNARRTPARIGDSIGSFAVGLGTAGREGGAAARGTRMPIAEHRDKAARANTKPSQSGEMLKLRKELETKKKRFKFCLLLDY